MLGHERLGRGELDHRQHITVVTRLVAKQNEAGIAEASVSKYSAVLLYSWAGQVSFELARVAAICG